MTKIELSLTNSQVEEIKKVPIEKTPIYMELFSKEWVKDLKLSKKTPIEYTDKEDITSIAFYRDKDCKEAIKGFVESGQTIYARVTTRGLDDSDIALFIYKHGTVTEEETSTKGGVYSHPLKTIFQHKACTDKLYADSFYKVQKNSHSSFEVICCRR